MDKQLILAAARDVAETLRKALGDFDAESVTLRREEAAVTLGLIDGIIEQLEREAGG